MGQGLIKVLHTVGSPTVELGHPYMDIPLAVKRRMGRYSSLLKGSQSQNRFKNRTRRIGHLNCPVKERTVPAFQETAYVLSLNKSIEVERRRRVKRDYLASMRIHQDDDPFAGIQRPTGCYLRAAINSKIDIFAPPGKACPQKADYPAGYVNLYEVPAVLPLKVGIVILLDTQKTYPLSGLITVFFQLFIMAGCFLDITQDMGTFIRIKIVTLGLGVNDYLILELFFKLNGSNFIHIADDIDRAENIMEVPIVIPVKNLLAAIERFANLFKKTVLIFFNLIGDDTDIKCSLILGQEPALAVKDRAPYGPLWDHPHIIILRTLEIIVTIEDLVIKQSDNKQKKCPAVDFKERLRR
jgi:hypothetical protein